MLAKLGKVPFMNCFFLWNNFNSVWTNAKCLMCCSCSMYYILYSFCNWVSLLNCRDDCTRLFSSCKAANESLSAEDICRRLGSSADNCIDLDTFATSSGQLIVRVATVTLELTNKPYTLSLDDYGSADYRMLKGQVKTEVWWTSGVCFGLSERLF